MGVGVSPFFFLIIFVPSLFIFWLFCMYLCMFVLLYVCVYVRERPLARARTRVCVSVSVRACVHACVCVCVCARARTRMLLYVLWGNVDVRVCVFVFPQSFEFCLIITSAHLP